MIKHFLKKNIESQNRGFTIVETLVAISIILIALVGPFMDIEHALTASYIARDQLIGNSLAQEAVEYVQNLRDNNYLYDRAHPGSNYTFLTGLNGFPNGSGLAVNCASGRYCTVDTTAPAVSSAVQCAGASSCPALYVNTVTGLYNQQSNGVATRFTRYITLCYMQPDSTCTFAPRTNEAKLTVTVKWITEQQPYQTQITEYIQNWL